MTGDILTRVYDCGIVSTTVEPAPFRSTPIQSPLDDQAAGRRARSAAAEDRSLFKLTADEEARLSALISRETPSEQSRQVRSATDLPW